MKSIRGVRADLFAVVLLLVLWLLFYWRLFTPVAADQASLKQGDFSGQFVAFAGYQYARLSHGEVPLWDPYNNGGLPFIADTQAAVFYPPRLLTVALSSLSGGWTYHALELEMTFHVLFYTLMMYAFVRRLTGSSFAGLIAAIVAGYGGYLSGYPPLQLALLEAGVWLPLAALGILEATRGERVRWLWLVVTGLALGVSWMAGHPQTSFFLTYLLLAWYAYRLWIMPRLAILETGRAARLRNNRVTTLILGAALFGLIAVGLAAVQLLPGVEYLMRTTRADFGYDAKSNGFPLQDVAQFFIPGVVSQWSPLWIGVTGLALALIALWRKLKGAWFWGAVALLALLWSFGGNSAVFPALYNLLPGLYYFRGQERAAYLVVNSLAILAGTGAAWLMAWDAMRDHVAGIRLRFTLNRAVYVALALTALVFVVWIGNISAYSKAVSMVTLSLIAVAALYLIVSAGLTRRPVLWALVALLVFELFTINMGDANVYDHVPPTQQISVMPTAFLAQTVAAPNDPFFVDGARGLTDNFGSLYRIMDVRGISPLFISGMHNLIEGSLPDPTRWELLAVRYVYSDWQQLPVPADVIASGTDRYGAVNLHRLRDPRPFALLAYNYVLVTDDQQAYAQLQDPTFNARRTVILQSDPGITSTSDPPQTATVMQFAPEAMLIHTQTPRAAILSLALPQYPGWYATVDDQPTPILRAYGALAAVVVPAGDHAVRLVYDPLSYRVGASLSLFTWLGVAILGLILVIRSVYVIRQRPPGMDRPA